MGLSEEIEKLKYDKRLMEWHVSRGKLSKDAMDKHLKELPDLASNVESFGLDGSRIDDVDSFDQE
jgi:hypothetical protein